MDSKLTALVGEGATTLANEASMDAATAEVERPRPLRRDREEAGEWGEGDAGGYGLPDVDVGSQVIDTHLHFEPSSRELNGTPYDAAGDRVLGFRV